MSKLIYVCFKDPSRCNPQMEHKIKAIAKRITPDIITPRATKIVSDGNVIYGIVNPTSTIEENGKSVLLGMAFGEHDEWWKPRTEIPDGSFSIFRSDSDRTEILTDVAASRSVWYYHDDDVFIASSSQRAIVMLLGSFEFNREVIPWMLSTGSLGPYLSWDSRIKLLPSDSSLLLDFKTWDCNVNTKEVEFKATDISEKELKGCLMTRLTDIFRSLKIDFSKWALPLSGGFDSRGILNLLHQKSNLILTDIKTVTWGQQSSLKLPGNDAYVAKRLAEHLGIQHKYYPTDLSQEPVEDVFNRFLVCGEGRVDHIGGYMDGFQIWKNLFEDEIQGVIRGDEGFGRLEVDSPSNVRSHVQLSLCAEFSNLKDFGELGLSGQKFPHNLEQKDNETLETWRDRLYHQYRMPMVLAGLSDLKLAFVEIVNPFLSRQLIYFARSIPDKLRTDKLLFKKVIHSLSPKIGYATSSANPDAGFLLKSGRIVDLFKAELRTSSCKSLMPERFIHYINANLVVNGGEVNWKQIFKAVLKRYLPKSIIKKASDLSASKAMGVNTLAFRIYLISRMNSILEEDAASLKAYQNSKSSKQWA